MVIVMEIWVVIEVYVVLLSCIFNIKIKIGFRIVLIMFVMMVIIIDKLVVLWLCRVVDVIILIIRIGIVGIKICRYDIVNVWVFFFVLIKFVKVDRFV